MSRKPCSGSKVKEASNCHPLIKFETRLQTHRRVSEGAALHACPSFILFPSIDFQQTSSLHGPLVLPLTPPGGDTSCGKICWAALVLHVPVCCSPPPCRSFCSLYAWVSFERISALERHGVQAHVSLARCPDTGRDCPGVGLWSTPQRSWSTDTAAEATQMMSMRERSDPGS